MKQALIYSLKVWFTTSILSPLQITLLRCYFLSSNHLNPFHDPKVYDRELLHLTKMLEGTWIALLPLGLGVYYAVILLSKRSIPIAYIKGYLCIIGVVLAVLPNALLLIYVLGSNEASLSRTVTVDSLNNYMICYILAVLASIWFYKLKPVSSRDSVESLEV
jgi:hypothetical protein